MPTHGISKIPGNEFWTCMEMGLNLHEVIRNSARDGSLHDGRRKLEWNFLVGWPGKRLTVIGGTQVFITAHGPLVPPGKIYVEGRPQTCFAEAQHFEGGGYCHDPFPELSPICSP